MICRPIVYRLLNPELRCKGHVVVPEATVAQAAEWLRCPDMRAGLLIIAAKALEESAPEIAKEIRDNRQWTREMEKYIAHYNESYAEATWLALGWTYRRRDIKFS